jgi:hypothetical protein
MKNTLQSFLEECRAAKTSDEIGAVVGQIEQRIAGMRAERSKFDGQLQEAIVAGRDPGKIHTAIAQADQDLMTLEAARAGFSQKQADVRKAEGDQEIKSLIEKQAQLTGALEAAARDFHRDVETARASAALTANLADQHARIGMRLEAAKQRPGRPASSIIRDTIGPVRRPEGKSEYGRRVDIAFADILVDNPSNMVRAMRLRRGRPGETNEARDMATEGWLNLAKTQ